MNDTDNAIFSGFGTGDEMCINFIDMLTPDLMPFADELLLALLTLLFGALGRRKRPRVAPVPIAQSRA